MKKTKNSSTFDRLLGSGYTLMIAGNALHAAKLAYVNGVDAVVVDFGIGRTNARDIVPELPASKHTKLPPLVCGIVGDDEPTPYAVPGYDLLTRAGEEEEIAAKVKAAAKSVIVGTQTHKGA